MDYIYTIRDDFRKRLNEIADDVQNAGYVCSSPEKAKIDHLSKKFTQINTKISRLIQNDQIPKLLDDELRLLSSNLRKMTKNSINDHDEGEYDQTTQIQPNLNFSQKNDDTTFVVPSKLDTTIVIKDNEEENLAPKMENKSNRKLQIEYLNDEEFKTIPSYMKGRLNLSQINQLIDKFNQCLLQKYDFLSKKATVLEDCRISKEKRIMYKRQLCPEMKNEKFLVENDLKTHISSPKDQQIFFKYVVQILRHFKRIREHRSGGFCRFVINNY